MASICATSLVLLVLFLLRAELSECQVVSGSVSCSDCTPHHLSGVGVAIKCSGQSNVIFALTDETGSYKANLPSSTRNCFAMLVSGPNKQCSFKKSKASKIVKAPNTSSFTTSTPLSLTASACDSTTTANLLSSKGAEPELESSKIIDLPLPPEWGLAPSSYYIPFVPIIGIP